MSSPQRTAVVLRFSSLGDIVLTTPVLDALHEDGYGRIVYVTKSAFAPLFAHDPRVSTLIALGDGAPAPVGAQASHATPVLTASGLLSLVRLIRGQNADRVLDLHGVLRTRLIGLAGLGAPVSRYDKGGVQRRVALRMRRWPDKPVHVIQRYLWATGRAEPTTIPRPRLYVSPEARAVAATLLRDSPSPRVALVPGAQWASKQWPLERFVELARKLYQSHGAAVVWLGGKKESAMKPVIGSLGPWSVDLIDRTDLTQLVAVIEACHIVAANDTGAMHMATAVGTPVVAIFGPTSRALGFWPTAPGDRIAEVEGLDCRPCTLHGADRCPLGHHRCMNDLAVEDVHRLVTERLR